MRELRKLTLSPLAEASMSGDENKVKELIEAGAGLNETDKVQPTLAHCSDTLVYIPWSNITVAASLRLLSSSPLIPLLPITLTRLTLRASYSICAAWLFLLCRTFSRSQHFS